VYNSAKNGQVTDASTCLVPKNSIDQQERRVTASPNLIGARLGGYDVQAVIGSGGMASVYRAFDPNLQRLVAIKVLSPATASQPDFVERFRQEARLIANLRHPNIVQVYDFGEQDGLIYMVQELLPGPTLEQRLLDAVAQGSKLSRDETLAITTQLAGALDAAHAAGIIHRDVKPSNALWNGYGALVLTDFGIAKNTLTTANYTQAGFVLGTPLYLSPEQAQGLPLTPASDIYALGVVLYELISGRTPFESPNPMRVVMAHVQDQPPPLRPLRPELPSAVETVVQRALAKDPAQRFGSAGELARAFEQAWAVEAPSINTAAPSIHHQATQHWTSPRVASSPALVPGPANPPSTVGAPPAGNRPAPTSGRPRVMLPTLGVLLVLLLLGGIFLALRRERGATVIGAPTVAGVSTSVPAQSASAVPSLPAVATALPASLPVAANDSTAVAVSPIDQLRALLVSGITDGRINTGGDVLIAKLDAVQGALGQNDTKTATAELQALQLLLISGARSGMIAPEMLRQTLTGVDAIAHSAGLTLPFSVTSG
jgi:eukaryotic-like serine/threonine-protein kinase